MGLKSQCDFLFQLYSISYLNGSYGYLAHRIALVDLGHVGENIYLASTSIGLGTCGIGACVTSICDEMFELEGENEFIIYAQPDWEGE